MKEKIFSFIAVLYFILFVGFIGGWESRYKRNAVCIGYINGNYVFVDNAGYTWEWEGNDETVFKLNGSYILIMDDNHTNNIYDDKIIKIKKIENRD